MLSPALLCGSVAGLLVLACYDSILLATVFAGVLAWLGWNKDTENKEQVASADTGENDLPQETRMRNSLLWELQEGTILSPVSIKEPISGIALLKQELTHKKVLDGVSAFEKEDLNAVDIEEKIVLPTKEIINLEKLILDHLKGIGEFDQANLVPVKTSEPISGPELVKQESWRSRITQELSTFDRSGLRLTPTRDKKNNLPSQSVIVSEKLHIDLMAGLTTGVKLKKTDTILPVCPVQLARLEMYKEKVAEDIQAFDKGRLTPVVTEIKSFFPITEDLSTNDALC